MITLGIIAGQSEEIVITTGTLIYSFRRIQSDYTGFLCTMRRDGVDTQLNSFSEIVSYLNASSSPVRIQRLNEQTGNGNDLLGNDTVILENGFPIIQVSSMASGLMSITGSFASMVYSDDGSSSVGVWSSTTTFAFTSQNSSSASTVANSGAPDIYNGTVEITDSRNDLRTAVLNQYAIINYRNIDFSSWTELKLGGYPFGFSFNGDFRELVVASGDIDDIVSNQKNFYNL